MKAPVNVVFLPKSADEKLHVLKIFAPVLADVFLQCETLL